LLLLLLLLLLPLTLALIALLVPALLTLALVAVRRTRGHVRSPALAEAEHFIAPLPETSGPGAPELLELGRRLPLRIPEAHRLRTRRDGEAGPQGRRSVQGRPAVLPRAVAVRRGRAHVVVVAWPHHADVDRRVVHPRRVDAHVHDAADALVRIEA